MKVILLVILRLLRDAALFFLTVAIFAGLSWAVEQYPDVFFSILVIGMFFAFLPLWIKHHIEKVKEKVNGN